MSYRDKTTQRILEQTGEHGAAYVMLVDTGGDPYNATGGAGGDASAANQQTGNTALQALVSALGQPDDAVASTVVDTATLISLIKAMGVVLLNSRDRLPGQIGTNVASQSLSVTPDSDTWKQQACALSSPTTAGTIAAGARLVSIKNLGTTDVTVAGGSLPAGESVTFNAYHGTLGEISYDAGTLLVTEQR